MLLVVEVLIAWFDAHCDRIVVVVCEDLTAQLFVSACVIFNTKEMDRICNSCRAVVPKECQYCPNCSLPLFHSHGLGLVRLFHMAKRMVSGKLEMETQ